LTDVHLLRVVRPAAAVEGDLHEEGVPRRVLALKDLQQRRRGQRRKVALAARINAVAMPPRAACPALGKGMGDPFKKTVAFIRTYCRGTCVCGWLGRATLPGDGLPLGLIGVACR